MILSLFLFFVNYLSLQIAQNRGLTRNYKPENVDEVLL